MPAAEVLIHLHAAGIHLEVDAGLIIASPRAALTAEHRALIREHKPALLSLLTADLQADVAEAQAERQAIMELDGRLLPVRAREVAELAVQFYSHHWSCPDCRAGTPVGAAVHRPCPEGVELWRRYCQAAGRKP